MVEDGMAGHGLIRHLPFAAPPHLINNIKIWKTGKYALP